MKGLPLARPPVLQPATGPNETARHVRRARAGRNQKTHKVSDSRAFWSFSSLSEGLGVSSIGPVQLILPTPPLMGGFPSGVGPSVVAGAARSPHPELCRRDPAKPLAARRPGSRLPAIALPPGDAQLPPSCRFFDGSVGAPALLDLPPKIAAPRNSRNECALIGNSLGASRDSWRGGMRARGAPQGVRSTTETPSGGSKRNVEAGGRRFTWRSLNSTRVELPSRSTTWVRDTSPVAGSTRICSFS